MKLSRKGETFLLSAALVFTLLLWHAPLLLSPAAPKPEPTPEVVVYTAHFLTYDGELTRSVPAGGRAAAPARTRGAGAL